MLTQELQLLRQVAETNIKRFSLNGLSLTGIAISIYDGDTCDLVLSIPDDGIKRLVCRLQDYNSPEMKSSSQLPDHVRDENRARAVHARDTLWALLGGQENPKPALRVVCGEWDKYGRLLCHIYRIKDDGSIDYCINEKMLDMTSSVAYNGKRQ